MSVPVGVSNNINTLLFFLLGPYVDHGQRVNATEEDAKAAAACLADFAAQALSGGWTKRDVNRLWRTGVKGGAGRFRRAAGPQPLAPSPRDRREP
jgi:hypothetical protein